MVLNVVDFHEKAPRVRNDATQRSPEGAIADIPGLISRVNDLQSKAKAELRDAILLLDLAAQHAR